MTKEEVIEEYGNSADLACRTLCDLCTANDWYCPSDCDSIAWVRRNYDRFIVRMQKLDGDYTEFLKRARNWK